MPTGDTMGSLDDGAKGSGSQAGRRSPPGRTRIMESIRSLLADRDFHAVTVAEIARRANVTEPLIYKYFNDKRDLLYTVLAEFIEQYLDPYLEDVDGVSGALNKVRKLILTHMRMYAYDGVFARVLLLEVRSFPDYFKSETYQMVKRYTETVLSLIHEGIESGEIRRDLPARSILQVILGAIEHACLGAVIFKRDINVEQATDNLCEILLIRESGSR
ncbi:MAG: TetR/AcrR family transcriptional regulator [Deltaproteobacteria bacterium]